MASEHICGFCKWHKHEDIDDGWICTNPDSEYVADWTRKGKADEKDNHSIGHKHNAVGMR